MGSDQFQREYIEYLQNRNTELLDRINHMKESYKSKILSRDFNKEYLISTLGEVLNICSAIPQEIDVFFDKITAAVDAFKDILVRKSDLVQMVEKISRVLNSNENFNGDFIEVYNSEFVKQELSAARVGKKGGMVKVSPMINGHIISTEPRIYLSRVPGVFTPERRNRTHQLSPIIEASPETSSTPSNVEGQVFKEIKIPLERININKLSYNYIREESPKSRFKGPKTWKKSISSNKRNSDCQKNEYLNKKLSIGEGDLHQQSQDVDPLEGPSWLYEENSKIIPSPSSFADYRRRKHRFATVFDNGEDCLTYMEKSRKPLKEVSVDFCKNNTEVSDEEEIRDRISESSEDYIRESSEDGERFSPLKKRRGNSDRNSEEDSNHKSDSIKLSKGKRISTSHSEEIKKKKISETPVKFDSSHEGNNENDPVHKVMKDRESFKRSPLKLLSEKMSNELSFEKTPRRSDRFSDRGGGISETSKTPKGRRSLLKYALENEVMVKPETTGRNSSNKSIRKRSSGKMKFKKSKSRSKSGSPMVIGQQTESRARRKAAPTFKLVEPKLRGKLRREK